MVAGKRRVRVFLGSSGQSKDIMEAAANRLEATQHIEPVRWTKGFELSEGTLSALERHLDDCDFAVLILSPDDTINKGGETVGRPAPRDNVVFELGLFMGRLGRGRVYALFPSNVDMAMFSDFHGITYASYKHIDSTTRNAAFCAAMVDEACEKVIERTRQLGFQTPYRFRHPPRVMVTGSQGYEYELAIKSARAFGRRLADLDVRAISGVAKGVDEYFCLGFAEGLRERGRDPSESLICYYKDGEPGRAHGGGQLRKSKFQYRTEDVPELISEADITVFFGGGSSVAYLGAVALRENRIVLPVAAAGGSARGLLTAVMAMYEPSLKKLVSRDDLERLQGQMAPEVIADHCVKLVRDFVDCVPKVQ